MSQRGMCRRNLMFASMHTSQSDKSIHKSSSGKNHRTFLNHIAVCHQIRPPLHYLDDTDCPQYPCMCLKGNILHSSMCFHLHNTHVDSYTHRNTTPVDSYIDQLGSSIVDASLQTVQDTRICSEEDSLS